MTRRNLLLAVATSVIVGGLAVFFVVGQRRSDDGRSEAAPRTQRLTSRPDRGLLIVRDQALILRDMASDTEYEIKRTPSAGVYVNHPRWSPDGTRIAYAITTQFAGLPNQDWGSDLAVSASDGSDERMLVRRAQPGIIIEGIAWSADGSRLYVGVTTTTIRDGRFIGQTGALETVDVASGARTRISDNALLPTVAADGSRIAYIVYSRSGETGGLWTANPDGTEARPVVPLPGAFISVASPRFSPDGRRIAFTASTSMGTAPGQSPHRTVWRWPWQPQVARAHGLPLDVWVVAVGGGTPERLTHLTEEDISLTWSADGSELALIAASGLFRMSSSGGEPRRLSRGALEAQIDWR